MLYPRSEQTNPEGVQTFDIEEEYRRSPMLKACAETCIVSILNNNFSDRHWYCSLVTDAERIGVHVEFKWEVLVADARFTQDPNFRDTTKSYAVSIERPKSIVLRH